LVACYWCVCRDLTLIALRLRMSLDVSSASTPAGVRPAGRTRLGKIEVY